MRCFSRVPGGQSIVDYGRFQRKMNGWLIWTRECHSSRFQTDTKKIITKPKEENVVNESESMSPMLSFSRRIFRTLSDVLKFACGCQS